MIFTTATLLTLLLAGGAQESVTPTIELQPLANQTLELQLCFQGNTELLHFELHIDSIGTGGRSRSRQQGHLQLVNEQRCPVQLRLGNMLDRELRLRLEWSVDGVQQPPLLRNLQQS